MVLSLCAGCGTFGPLPQLDVFAASKGDIAPSASGGSDQEKVTIETAKAHFRKGEYGEAEHFYREAVEQRASNVEAWIGLAATYDHLKRFDEADRAYDMVLKLAGTTPTVLNNLGYHLMLKGEFDQAAVTLHKAEQMDPKNPYIKNNLRILEQMRASGMNLSR